MHWDDLLTLGTLVRTGSYSACARELSLTHATVIRRLKRLELALERPVLVPSPGGIQLSAAGLVALQAANQMESAVQRGLRALDASTGSLAGLVRITATEALGTFFLTPRLAAFRGLHPELLVELLIDNRNLSLARRKAHIAVRLNRPQEEHLVAKRAGTMSFGLYHNQSRSKPAGKRGQESRQMYCQLAGGDETLPEVRWLRENVARDDIGYVSNSLGSVLVATEQGMGASVLPTYLAARSPSLTLLRELPQVSREVWIAFPAEYRRQRPFREAIDWLMEIMKNDMA